MGSELDALAGQYGVTTSAGVPAYVDPQDLPVYTGTGLGLKPLGTKTIGRLTPWLGTKEMTKRQSEIEKEFYSMAPEDRRELQKRLYAGGFYSGTDPDKVVLGVPDEVSFSAYAKAVARAAAYYNAGKKMTVDEVIDESAGILDQIYGAGGRRGGGAGGSGAERAPLTIGLTNPEDLKAVAQRTATGTIGRALSQSELSQFIASFHQAQATSQTNAYNADVTGGSVVAAPDESVAAEVHARQAAPTEAGGQDFLRTFTAFRNILSRGA